MTVQAPKEETPAVTTTLCQWIHQLDVSQIPADVLERGKYLILDGIACGLVGSHVPWSEKCAAAISVYEPAGYCSVLGYGEKYGPLAAAILNGSFIQAVELDDYHSIAPLHSASVILPALWAAAQVRARSSGASVPGLDFLVAAIVGFETGPRAGSAIYGADLLSRGWHSGPIFGCPAAAAASSKLLGLNPDDMESAIGIACTQAGGLMAAQYEGMVKRVQHAFAARNGLFGALLARDGYVGIKKVFERPYGGFLAMFSQGNQRNPPYKLEEVTAGLGTTWQTQHIRIKLYACVGGCHGQIEALENLQRTYPDRFARDQLAGIRQINVHLSAPVFAHDGWAPEVRPLTATGAQMNAAFIGAAQLVDGQVLLTQFEDTNLDREEYWELIAKTSCFHSEDFDKPNHACGARVEVVFEDGFQVEETVQMPRGFDPPIRNDEILAKWRRLVSPVMDHDRLHAIEKMVLNLEKVDMEELLALIHGPLE